MEIRVLRDNIPGNLLTRLLQEGVACPASTPATVYGFLTEQLGTDPGYVHDRIATIFLDGKAVDQPERAIVRDGCLLSLSAAMPGLVGATLRKGGYYASMRSQISWTSPDDRPSGEASAGAVRVRLFNLILRERGPALLARGIVVDRSGLVGLLGEEACAAWNPPAGEPILLRVVDESTAGPGSELACA